MTQQLSDPSQSGATTPPRSGALISPIDWAKVGLLPVERLLGARMGVAAPETLPQAAREALRHWNAYVATGAQDERDAFFNCAQALWQGAQELPDGGAGWPLPIGRLKQGARASRLSASMQALAISTLARVYALTDDANILQLARAAAHALQRDIFDGGASAPIANLGDLPQDVAAYPSDHGLAGVLLALLALHELAVVDPASAAAYERMARVFRRALPAYDLGHGIRDTLTTWGYASEPSYRVCLALLGGLARVTSEPLYQQAAARWARYRRLGAVAWRRLARLRAGVGGLVWRVARGLSRRAARGQAPGALENALMVITAFPVAGGTRSVVASIAVSMADRWRLTYLTAHVGPNPDHLEITKFGNRLTNSWQFPNAWLYVIFGYRALLRMLRQRPYRVMIPQDGLFSGIATALAGRLLGVRVATMDHGTLTLPDSPLYHGERRKDMLREPLPRRTLSALRFSFHWPSLRLMARWSISLTDHWLIAGDEVEDEFKSYKHFPPGRITRYPYMVDSDFFHPLSASERDAQRAAAGLPVDAIVVCMNSRLSPAKGFDYAIEALRRALEMTPEPVSSRVRIVIAGNGPLREQIEADLRRTGLDGICLLWGEATVPEVATILGMSDIFVYASIRGTNVSVALLEAMAAGCAVVGTTAPISHARILSDGRGASVAPGDVEALAQALAQYLLHPEARQAAGEHAREYARAYHSAEALRRCLLRASGWEPGDKPVTEGV